MRIGDIIGDIRTTVRAHSDDSNFSDEYLYNLINSYRALFLKRRFEKTKVMSPLNWQTVCLSLKRTKYTDCDCIDVGCDVLKSEKIVPAVLTGRNKPLIKVQTFDGVSLPYISPDRMKTNKYSNVLVDVPGYYIQNKKVIIWNSLYYKAVMITGIYEDPIVLSTYNICDSQGTPYDACSYNPLLEEYPIDADLIPLIRQAVLQDLGISMQIADDTKNDSQSHL